MKILTAYRKGEPVEVLVSDEDFDQLYWRTDRTRPRRWNVRPNGYVGCTDRSHPNASQTYGVILLHRLVMGFPDKDVDHINRNKLDNQRDNLRVVTRSENLMNTGTRAGKLHSTHRGVTQDKRRGKWIARFCGEFLGSFDTEDDAAAAYAERGKQRT